MRAFSRWTMRNPERTRLGKRRLGSWAAWTSVVVGALCLVAAVHAAPFGAPPEAAPTGAIASAAANSAAESAGQVTIHNYAFGPSELTVPVGTTVTWTNKDDEAHTVTSETKAFKSSALDTDDTFSFTFNEPGTYKYFCSLHAHMRGTVVVVAK
jgi:plastocyanin